MGGTWRWKTSQTSICGTEVPLGSLGFVFLHLLTGSENVGKIFIVLVIKMTTKCCLH